MDVSPEPLGVAVGRLSLNPGAGRLHHPMQVGIAVRAGIFVDLALAGRLTGLHWPEAVGESDTGDPLPDAVHRAVAGTRPRAWGRWFNHVEADRRAVTDHLVATGAWRLDGRRIVDPLGAQTLLEQRAVAEAVAGDTTPPDLHTAILWLLLAGSGGTGGRPTPRRCWRLAQAWLPDRLPAGAGNGTAGSGEAAYQTVRWSLRAIRRAATFRIFAR